MSVVQSKKTESVQGFAITLESLLDSQKVMLVFRNTI